MKHFLLLTFALILCLCSNKTLSQPAKQKLSISIPYRSSVAIINNKPSVYYELFITNQTAAPLRLKELKIFDPANSNTEVILSEQDMASKSSRPGNIPGDSSILLLPDQSCLLYLEIKLEKKQVNHLINRLEFEAIKNDKAERGFSELTFSISKNNTAPVIGPPLKGGYWAAIYDPSWLRGHRRVTFTENKKSFIPGRYAIDFVKLDERGKYASADEVKVANWFGYGSEVIAVADGIVAAVRTDVKEDESLPGKPISHAEDAAGNYIALKIGKGQYAFYEHLQPNSIKVKAGQLIKKGDVIASLGFTGQSTGPHLHFHMSNQHVPLFAEGMPFSFESFKLIGVYTDFASFGKKRWTAAENKTLIKRAFPPSNSVVQFQ